MNQGNKIVPISDYQTFLDNWPFLLEGLGAVKADSADNIPDVSNDEYFKTLLRLATQPEAGLILVLKSKNNKPLGFLVLVDTTVFYRPKTLNCYLAYTNGKCPSTLAELKFDAERWARERGFNKLQAISYRVKPAPRLSGAVRRYFNRTLGLRERCVVFEAEL